MIAGGQSMQFYLLGENAAVLQSRAAPELQIQRRIWALARQWRASGDYLDIVPGMNNLSVIFDPERHAGAHLLQRLRHDWDASAAADFAPRRIAIPVQYGGAAGPDLAVVATHCGLSEAEVIDAHSGADYLVYFLGFQPGFAYLGGLPPQLATPRRSEPRLAVPAGSVGIGGPQTGIYPAASPGGWQLIGHSSLVLFDPEQTPPSLLQPGDLVRFVVEHGDA